MKLYEIDERLREIADNMEPDENGEITGEIDALIDEIDALNMERSERLDWIAKQYLNTRAAANAKREEEKRLAESRARSEKQADRWLSILARYCNGEKTELSVGTFCARKSTRVNVKDENVVYAWCVSHGFNDCIETKTSVKKSQLKRYMQDGLRIPNCELEEHENYRLK